MRKLSPLSRAPEALRKPGWRPVLTGALCAALALSASASRAEPAGDLTAAAGPEGQRYANAAERLELRELRADRVPSRNPLGFVSENLHFNKGTGFEYRHQLLVGERSLVLGLQGPVVRKKKRLGLTVVVRF